MLGVAAVSLCAAAVAWGTGHVFVALAVLFIVVGAGSWPVAMRVTHRLTLLEEAVDAWGKGALDRRVPVWGQDEVARLAERFNEAAARVEVLVEGQRRMLATASHELRSPLARLRVAIDLLGGPEHTKEAAAREIAELDTLIGEVLLASRLDAGTAIAKESVELLALVAEEAAHVGAQVEGETVTVQGDARILRRMVRNLLENARRYGTVVVARVGPGARVTIEDDGPGVPVGERERIFEPFFRVSGHREGADGGVGLGLALVRQIARAHGAEATMEPREGGGSRFIVAWPP